MMNKTSEPEQEAFLRFWSECQQEARRRFGVDEQHDSLVVVDLTDRSRFESSQCIPVPKFIKHSPYHRYATTNWAGRTHTPAEEDARERILLENQIERFRNAVANHDITLKLLKIEIDLVLQERTEIAEAAELKAMRDAGRVIEVERGTEVSNGRVPRSDKVKQGKQIY